MPKVTFLPMNLTYEAPEGESILDIALNNDVPLQHACGGFCACTTCHIEVKAGLDSLSPMDEDEEERLDRVTGMTPQSRLGCQAKLRGAGAEVIVEIQNIEK
jgi:2Fe-2S ferredoxin